MTKRGELLCIAILFTFIGINGTIAGYVISIHHNSNIWIGLSIMISSIIIGLIGLLIFRLCLDESTPMNLHTHQNIQIESPRNPYSDSESNYQTDIMNNIMTDSDSESNYQMDIMNNIMTDSQ